MSASRSVLRSKRAKSECFQFDSIGLIQSDYKEKFGTPRQSGLVSDARGIIQLHDDPDLITAVKMLEGFSHLWVIFVFHQRGSRAWKPSIRPPRLGGAKRVGVLASRSPHRPNPIGLSVFEIERIDPDHPQGVQIHVKGLDVIDGTPVLDLKPYVPYADAYPDARSGWAATEPETAQVTWSARALAQVLDLSGTHPARGYTNLKSLIEQTLSQDPRPASQRRKLPADSEHGQGTRYAFAILDFDVRWIIRENGFEVLEVIRLGTGDAPPR